MKLIMKSYDDIQIRYAPLNVERLAGVNPGKSFIGHCVVRNVIFSLFQYALLHEKEILESHK